MLEIIGIEINNGSRGAEGAMAPPALWKLVIKKMATEGGRIDFMFLSLSPLPGRWIRYCEIGVRLII